MWHSHACSPPIFRLRVPLHCLSFPQVSAVLLPTANFTPVPFVVYNTDTVGHINWPGVSIVDVHGSTAVPQHRVFGIRHAR